MKSISRRWFRFGLPTMFALITLACLTATWSVHQLQWIKQRQEARLNLTIKRNGAIYISAVAYSDDVRAPGLLWLFGERGEREILLFTSTTTEDEVLRYKALFPETSITTMPPNIW